MDSSRPSAPDTGSMPKEGLERRGFVARVTAGMLGAVVALVPMAAGLLTFFDPLRGRVTKGDGKRGRLVRVVPLDALIADGMPRQFPVIADRFDAWNRFPDQSIGTVFLRRLPASNQVQAFNAICPHAGCFVAFKTERKQFQCPCHASAFAIDGKMIQPTPSPRDLDELDTEVKDNAVWVWYQEFHGGKEAKKSTT